MRCPEQLESRTPVQVVLADAVGMADVERGTPFSFDTYCRMYCDLWQQGSPDLMSDLVAFCQLSDDD